MEPKHEDIVDFSKLKLELYDFVGVMFPGLLAISEGWIVLRGWHAFVLVMNGISGTALTLLIVLAFGIGNIVQELGNACVKALKGKRFFQRARDTFWLTEQAQLVRDTIKRQFGQDILNVDAAFDYCLTKLKADFAKRDVFVATSDLSRSLVMLSALALVPAVRIAIYDIRPLSNSASTFFMFLLILASISSLAWRRMVRFRALSETTVFLAYLATLTETGTRP